MGSVVGITNRMLFNALCPKQNVASTSQSSSPHCSQKIYCARVKVARHNERSTISRTSLRMHRTFALANKTVFGDKRTLHPTHMSLSLSLSLHRYLDVRDKNVANIIYCTRSRQIDGFQHLFQRVGNQNRIHGTHARANMVKTLLVFCVVAWCCLCWWWSEWW